MTNTQLKNLIESLGISQARFANAVDLPELLVSRWETGEYKIPDEVANVFTLLAPILREFYEHLEGSAQHKRRQ